VVAWWWCIVCVCVGGRGGGDLWRGSVKEVAPAGPLTQALAHTPAVRPAGSAGGMLPRLARRQPPTCAGPGGAQRAAKAKQALRRHAHQRRAHGPHRTLRRSQNPRQQGGSRLSWGDAAVGQGRREAGGRGGGARGRGARREGRGRALPQQAVAQELQATPLLGAQLTCASTPSFSFLAHPCPGPCPPLCETVAQR
jgi:hypothetical protein